MEKNNILSQKDNEINSNIPNDINSSQIVS